jgi:hypothetical protein
VKQGSDDRNRAFDRALAESDREADRKLATVERAEQTRQAAAERDKQTLQAAEERRQQAQQAAEERAKVTEQVAAERAEAAQKAEAQRVATLEALAFSYSAEIAGWHARADVLGLHEQLGKSWAYLPGLAVAVHQVLSVREAGDSMATEVRAVAEEQMPLLLDQLTSTLSWTTIRAASIPNIWSTKFKREDVELFGRGALLYFINMSSIWTNIALAVPQLPTPDDAVDFVLNNTSQDVKSYLDHVASFLKELADIVVEFIEFGTSGGQSYIEYTRARSLTDLAVPATLVERSRQVSPNIAALRQEILDRKVSAFQEKLDATTKRLQDELKNNPR